ncbi:MAG: PQQ repeat protein [Elusimicrobia bacterium]|nr:MAG: PQQ repeat protein [Elusimicrobiota bacterium]KAF0157674.1 MAG: PQQ repeat protein [Elusimicrobiota bacterium]
MKSSLSPLFIAFAFSLSSAADWPMFRGNERRTGYAREQAAPPLSPAWDFQIQGDVVSSPAVYEGIVYVGARSGSLYALDAGTGQLLWDYSTDGWIDASPAVSSGTVYVTSRDGNLYAFNRQSGGLLWRAPLGAPSISSPLVFGGKVYAGTGAPGNRLKVFDSTTGTFLWEYKANQPVDSTPATDGSGVFFGSNDGRMYALDMESRSGKWGSLGQTVGTFGVMTAAVSSLAVYAVPSGNTGELYKLDPPTGGPLGKYEPYSAGSGLMETASPVLTGNRIYYSAGNSPHTLYCLDSDSLGFISSAPVLGNTSVFGMPSSPAMAGAVIYAGTADGRLVAVSSSGAVLQEIILPSSSHSSPAVSNGHVFIGTMGGRLWAYKAAKIAAISAPREYELIKDTITIRGYIRNPALTGYSLEYGTGVDPSTWTFISSAAATTEIENGILGYWGTQSSPNGLYTIRLNVFPSQQDNFALATVRVNYPPLPPTGLTAADVLNDAGNKLRLDWTPSASMGVSGYRIYRSTYGVFSLLSEVSSTTVSFIDPAAPTGVLFTYLLRAYDGYVESLDSNRASAASVNDNPSGDTIPPAAIMDLKTAQGAKGGDIVLTWTAPGDDGNVGTAAYYIIRHSTDSAFDWTGNFDGAVLWKSSRAVTGAAGTAETETVTGLFGGVTYYFAIKTADDIPNFSTAPATAAAWATLDVIAPGAPSGLTVSDTPGDRGGRLTLGWTRSPDDGAGANDVYGYKVYRSQAAGQYISSAPYALTAAGETGYLDAAAPVNLKFYYIVTAFDSSNNSVPSAEAAGISADNWRFFDAAQGGSVRLADGMEVNIPRNAVNQNDNIMVTRLNPATYQPLSVKANTQVRPTGVVYEIKFENPGTKLTGKAAITLPYTDADIAGLDEENLRIYKLAGPEWRLLDTSEVLSGANKVRAETDSFSVFGIMQYVPSGALMTAGAVYTYPNPARGDSLTFKFHLSDKASVSIDVYNAAGEKVAALSRPNCPAGLTSEIAWDIRKIASGVYVYRVRAESASGAKTVTKKLAVIH